MNVEPSETNPAGALSPAQRKHLRSLAHHLDPAIRIGRSGATEAVVRETSRTIEAHELIKVRIDCDDGADRRATAREVAAAAGAHLVGTIGKVAILYRRNDEHPKIRLPRQPGNKG